MKIILSLLLWTIVCGGVYARVVSDPHTLETYTYNHDDYDIIEGDIRVRKNEARNGLRDPKRLWPNRVIPYKINGTFTASEMCFLNKAIQSFYDKTCIKFVPATRRHKRFVSICNFEKGCWSDIGYYASGLQQINFGHNCLNNIITPVHELLHTCGIEHEHNRYDRDEYIKIIEKNIQPDMEFNFKKVDPATYSDYGVPYNYKSVMHYPLDSFAKHPGLNTMVTLKPHEGPMGYDIGWADSDVQKLHLMYNCESRFS